MLPDQSEISRTCRNTKITTLTARFDFYDEMMTYMLGLRTHVGADKQREIETDMDSFRYLFIFKDISCLRSISEPLEQLIVKLLQVR